MLLEARRLVHSALESRGTTLVDDLAVPPSRLPDLTDGVQRIARARRHHLLPRSRRRRQHAPHRVFDRGDAVAEARAVAAFEDVMELGLALGGTITGEHGVGLVKRSFLETELGPVSGDCIAGSRTCSTRWASSTPGKILRNDVNTGDGDTCLGRFAPARP